MITHKQVSKVAKHKLQYMNSILIKNLGIYTIHLTPTWKVPYACIM